MQKTTCYYIVVTTEKFKKNVISRRKLQKDLNTSSVFTIFAFLPILYTNRFKRIEKAQNQEILTKRYVHTFLGKSFKFEALALV